MPGDNGEAVWGRLGAAWAVGGRQLGSAAGRRAGNSGCRCPRVPAKVRVCAIVCRAVAKAQRGAGRLHLGKVTGRKLGGS